MKKVIVLVAARRGDLHDEHDDHSPETGRGRPAGAGGFSLVPANGSHTAGWPMTVDGTMFYTYFMLTSQ